MISSLRSGMKKMLWDSASTNIVMDGNSLAFGYNSSTTAKNLEGQTAALSVIHGTNTIANIAVSGQTVRQMNGLDGGSITDVTNAFSSAKSNNVLICWETTNSVFNTGRTGVQTAADWQAYIAARLAAQPSWKIILMTAMPRYQEANIGGTGGTSTMTIQQANEEIKICNALMKQNFRSWGAIAVCDVCAPGSPFDITDYTYATFSAATWKGASPWSTVDTGNNRIHMNDNGFAYHAFLLNETLKRIPA